MAQEWNESKAVSFLTTFSETALSQCILQMNKGERPRPSCYIPPKVIDFHLDKYKQAGASRIGTSHWAMMDNYTHVDHKGENWVNVFSDNTNMLRDCSKHQDKVQCVLTELDSRNYFEEHKKDGMNNVVQFHFGE